MEFALLGVLAVVVIVAVASIAPRLGVAAPILLVLLGIAASYVPGVPTLDDARAEGAHASHVIDRAQAILDVEQSRLDIH